MSSSFSSLSGYRRHSSNRGKSRKENSHHFLGTRSMAGNALIRRPGAQSGSLENGRFNGAIHLSQTAIGSLFLRRGSEGSFAPRCVPRVQSATFQTGPKHCSSPYSHRPKAQETVAMPSGFRVVFAGNVGVAQDFETILGAAEHLREFCGIQFIILGDGRMRDWVANQIRRRRLERSVHLLGSHPLEAMPGFFAQSDVMLVTLKSDPNFSLTLPAKIQSYMACSRPIVTAVNGGNGQGGRGVRCRHRLSGRESGRAGGCNPENGAPAEK